MHDARKRLPRRALGRTTLPPANVVQSEAETKRPSIDALGEATASFAEWLGAGSAAVVGSSDATRRPMAQAATALSTVVTAALSGKRGGAFHVMAIAKIAPPTTTAMAGKTSRTMSARSRAPQARPVTTPAPAIAIAMPPAAIAPNAANQAAGGSILLRQLQRTAIDTAPPKPQQPPSATAIPPMTRALMAEIWPGVSRGWCQGATRRVRDAPCPCVLTGPKHISLHIGSTQGPRSIAG